jgi:hypothetical protein
MGTCGTVVPIDRPRNAPRRRMVNKRLKQRSQARLPALVPCFLDDHRRPGPHRDVILRHPTFLFGTECPIQGQATMSRGKDCPRADANRALRDVRA